MTKMLTDVTWAKADHMLRRNTLLEKGWSWPEEVDLARHLAADLPIPEAQARLLASAATSGNPVVLTWDTVLRNRYEPDVTERTTTTVTVQYVTHWPAEPEKQQPARVRIRYWGFEHDIYSTQIVDVRTPDTEQTFS